MIGSSRALFRAVVVMGAALAGCDRSATPVEPATDQRGGPGEAAARGPEPVDSSVQAAVEEVVEPEVVEPEVVEPEVVGAVDPVTLPVAVVEAAKAEVKAKRRPKKDLREKCPQGSERPYPPCFYIL